MVEIYGYSVVTIPVVVALVYAVVEFFKNFIFENTKKFSKCIPIIATALGGAFTLIAFFVSPEVVPAATWYSALLMGCASGLSAVGVNQIKKQAAKKEGDGGNNDNAR